MRTTLLHGVLRVNEVETSPRHHAQRRAVLCTLRPRRPSSPKLLLPCALRRVATLDASSPPARAVPRPSVPSGSRDATASSSLMSCPRRAVTSTSPWPCSSRRRKSSSVMSSAVRTRHLVGSWPGAVAPDLLHPLLDVRRRAGAHSPAARRSGWRSAARESRRPPAWARPSGSPTARACPAPGESHPPGVNMSLRSCLSVAARPAPSRSRRSCALSASRSARSRAITSAARLMACSSCSSRWARLSAMVRPVTPSHFGAEAAPSSAGRRGRGSRSPRHR